MKKSTLALAVAATAVTTGAHAWDNIYFNNTVDQSVTEYIGQSPVYLHSFQQLAGILVCDPVDYAANGGACPAPAGITETQDVIVISGGFDASGNAIATATSDVTCTDTNPLEADALTGLATIVQNGSVLNAGAGTQQSIGAGVSPDLVACDVQVDSTGKITGGWSHNNTSIPAYGLLIDSYRDYGNGYTVVLDGCSTSPDFVTEVEPQLLNFLVDRDPADFDESALPSGCVLTSMMQVEYLTCDIDNECGQFTKSVPVPAFAAGALGLGLMGITFLTARRRSVR